MPAASSTIFCPAGQWTQVDWLIGVMVVIKHYRVLGSGITVHWRWFSAGVPPYWEGSFVDEAEITLLPSLYFSLEFNPSIDTTVVRGLSEKNFM